MIIGSINKYNIGDKIKVIGPEGRFISGIIPGIVIGFATKEEYLNGMRGVDKIHIPSESILNKANFYRVSVD